MSAMVSSSLGFQWEESEDQTVSHEGRRIMKASPGRQQILGREMEETEVRRHC